MKFRRLTVDELKQMEKEFITFLASNSITALDWESLKKREPRKATTLIELFSDIVFEKALANCLCIEQLSSKELRVYRFFDSSVKLIVVKVHPDSKLELTDGQLSKNIMQLIHSSSNQISLYKAQKNYKKLREQEMFEILQLGGYMADANLFEALNKLVS